MATKIYNKERLSDDEDDMEYLEGVRLETQYVKYKSRDRKVQKRRERDMDEWYD